MSVDVHTKVPLFDVRALTRVFGHGESAVHALRGIDLELAEGEVVILLGPSGSGKSTLLNILGGLDAPTQGSVKFAGRALHDMDERELTDYRRTWVGFIFQFYNLIPSLTARENIELVTDIAVNPLPVDEALAMVGLSHRGEHFPAQLSGGEQQRVAIARALAKRPRMLFCDEPTGALDLKTGVLTLEALMQANHAFGTTLMIVTHNADIARLGDRVIHFADGRIREIVHNPVRAKPADLHW
ncbi:MAG: ABC transporter ATP-binding protein [Ahniella sp.]|nr:ABC transporter ATP-binding protein [Ahniella sp.]